MRLRGLIRKEFLQILRDPSSIAIAFLMPVVLLLLFGYGVSLDAEHVPIALVVEQPSADTAGFAGAFRARRAISRRSFMPNMREAEEALMARRCRAHRASAVGLRAGSCAEPTARPIQVIVNGVDANTARLMLGYVRGRLGRNGSQRQARRGGEALDRRRSRSSSASGSTANCAAATSSCPA